MRPTYRRLTQATIVVGALVLTTLATAAPISGKGTAGLTIRSVVVRGNEVTITVVNRTGRTQTSTVPYRVRTAAGIVDLTAQATAAAGQTTTISVALPDRVQDELPLGVVVDDGVPF
jgi:hypothetical protein